MKRRATNILFFFLSVLLFCALPMAAARFIFFGTPIWDPLMWFAAGPYVLPATVGQHFFPHLDPGRVFPLMVVLFLGWHALLGWLLRKAVQGLVARGFARAYFVLGLIIVVWAIADFAGFVQHRLREPKKIAVSLQETVLDRLKPGMTVSETRSAISRWLYVDTYCGYRLKPNDLRRLDGLGGFPDSPEQNLENAVRAIPIRSHWTSDGEEWMERTELLFDENGRLLGRSYFKYPVVYPGFLPKPRPAAQVHAENAEPEPHAETSEHAE